MTSTNPGMGFAIPIKLIRLVADQLFKYGEVHRLRPGITFNESTAALFTTAPVGSRAGALNCFEKSGPETDPLVKHRAANEKTSDGACELFDHLVRDQCRRDCEP